MDVSWQHSALKYYLQLTIFELEHFILYSLNALQVVPLLPLVCALENRVGDGLFRDVIEVTRYDWAT
jgi:hypothetical protein